MWPQRKSHGRRNNHEEDDEGSMQPSSPQTPQRRKHIPGLVENIDPQQQQGEELLSISRRRRSSSGAGGVVAIGLPSLQSPALCSVVAVGLPLPADDDEATKCLISKLVATDMARQDHKDKEAASGEVVVKQRPPPAHRKSFTAPADDDLEAAKRREIGRSPLVASDVVVTARSPPARKSWRQGTENAETENQERGHAAATNTSTRKSPPNQNTMRQEDGSSHSRSGQLFIDSSSTHSRSSHSEHNDSLSPHSREQKPSAASDVAMAVAKRREREQGPTVATARALFIRNVHDRKSAGEEFENASYIRTDSTKSIDDRKPAAKGSDQMSSSNSSLNGTHSAHDTMMEEKRRGRDSAAAVAVARAPLPRKTLSEKSRPSAQDDAITTNSSSHDVLLETKRREIEQESSTAAAMLARKPALPRNASADRKSAANDTLEDVKRREREEGPSTANPIVARKPIPRHQSGEGKPRATVATGTLVEAQRHSREQGPSSATTAVDRKPTPQRNQSADKNAAATVALEEAKRREQGVFTAIATAARKPTPPRNQSRERKPQAASATVEEARRHEGEQGPSTAIATVARKPTPPRNQSRERKPQAESGTVTLEAAKRREREQGPSIATAMVARKPPPRHQLCDQTTPVAAAAAIDTLEAGKRREQEQVASTATAVARAPLAKDAFDENKGSAHDAMLREKRQERESKQATAVARAPRHRTMEEVPSHRKSDEKHQERKNREVPTVSRSAIDRKLLSKKDEDLAETMFAIRDRGAPVAAEIVTPRPRARLEGTASARSITDDMAEAKRRERERGPALASAVVTSRQRAPLACQASPTSATDDMAEAKRRERERGPAVAAAVVGRPSIDRGPQGRKNSSDSDMEKAKRRERERSPALASAIISRRTPSAQPRTVDRMPSLSEKDQTSGQEEIDDLSTDSAYALAMARSNMRSLKETEKLKEQESGPSLAPATGGEVHPGAFSIVAQELNAKEQDNGPSLAPAFSPDMTRSQSFASDEDEGITVDIEAQAGVPVVFPGAFAVQGVTTEASESEYSSSDESVTFHSGHDSGFGDHIDIEGSQSHTVNSALQAEIYEEVVVEGAVVAAEDDEDILDPKALRRLRMMQVTVICFSLGAIGLIIGSVLGFSNNWHDAKPKVEGWVQVGPDLYGPTDEPKTLFGSALAMSGNGTLLAVTAPGTDNGTSLNVGEVYIMEEIQNENGTFWEVLDIISGPGTSNEAQMALAMSQDATWLAVGYPRLKDGSRVQLYHDQEGAWKPETLPIKGPGDGDEEWFGYAVDLSADGSILAIGAPVMDGPLGSNSGAVQVYQKNEVTGTWVKMGSDLVGAAPNEFFGWSVSLRTSDGYRLAVGAPVSDDTNGLVRVFDWNGAAWARAGSDLVGDVPLNRFGESVSLSNDGLVLAVGARGTAFETGQAKIFRDINGEWVADENAVLGQESGEGFGSSVKLSSDGSILAVGGPQNNLFGDSAGFIKVFEYDIVASSWNQQGSDIGSERVAELGSAVVMSSDGKRVAGGAPTSAFDGSIARAGCVLVYDREKTQE